ncbi:MAG: hypothetical protein NZV14_13410 [Bryobacteraceae bacterium]|nr:hypothetical protein [Bryobacteraceae bacterium]MDW8379155.1 hypothetical protein [Bryobacterales bacterium]
MHSKWKPVLGVWLFILFTQEASAPWTQSVFRKDPRLIRLERFFRKYSCPITPLSRDFLQAADAYQLDWRLLPSIAFVESSGGKNYRNNNIFGWGNAEIPFPSVRDGIYAVAERMANARPYQGKRLEQFLATYNPHEGYPDRVKAVMVELGPIEPSFWLLD